jgi:AcrR family transcriptional regulator
MLNACATLVDEVGYEGLTTTLLAERAGVAIGSVYQFFPDKRAVVQALTQRNLEVYLSRLTEQVSASDGAHWWGGVETALDEYVRMHRITPGFRTLHFGDVVDMNLLDTSRDNNAVIADHLAGLLVDRFAVPDTDRLRFSLAVAVEGADALIKLAFRRDPAGDDRVVTEAKTLLREYLHRQLEPASTSGGKRRSAGKP